MFRIPPFDVIVKVVEIVHKIYKVIKDYKNGGKEK